MIRWRRELVTKEERSSVWWLKERRNRGIMWSRKTCVLGGGREEEAETVKLMR